jgi:hypothetical protein
VTKISHPGEPGEDGSKSAPKCAEASGNPSRAPATSTAKGVPDVQTTMTPDSTTRGEMPGHGSTTAVPPETRPSKCGYNPTQGHETSGGYPTLLVVKAGSEYHATDGILVVDGDYICPKDYDSEFSLVCEVPYPTRSVTFEVDDADYRTEKRVPYAISGDTSPARGKHVVRPWKVKDGPLKVTCITDKEAVHVQVTIGCKGTGMTSPAEVTGAPESTTYVATKRAETEDRTTTYPSTKWEKPVYGNTRSKGE